MKINRVNMFLLIGSILAFIVFISPSLRVEAMELPKELRQLAIGDKFIKTSLKAVGKISRLTGKGRAVVVHRAKQEAYYANEGDPVYENDALYTLIDCRCRIEFQDKNVVIMAPDTHLDIDEIYESITKGQKRSLFGLTKGKAIFYALRLFRYPKMTLKLKTPTATVGIRGTKFGIEVERPKKGRSSVLNRMLASRNLELVQLSPGNQNIIARVYGIEGEVDVTSLIDGKVQRLRENEILEADRRGLGKVRYDPEGIKAFIETVISGMETAPGLEPKKYEDQPHREDSDRIEKMIDIQQQEREPQIRHEPEQQGGGGHQ